MKKIKINEAQLRDIIKEAVSNITASYEIKEFSKENDEDWEYIVQNKKKLWDFLDSGYQMAGYEKFCGCDNVRSLIKNAILIKIAVYNEDWVAACVYTGYRGGVKNVGITATTDKNLRNIGKLAINEIIRTDIVGFDEFYWTECSGAIEHLYEKHNGIKVPNEYAFGILQKPLTPLSDGFHYEREVKGDLQTKIIFGFNNKETFEIVKKEHTKYIQDCINKITATQINEETEEPSFGKLSKVQCSIAVINFFLDMRLEEGCYDLSKESLCLLKQHVDFLKQVLNNIGEDNTIQMAVERGEDILMTSSVIVLKKL